jgi:N-acylneuraminate cytidylyltransferase
MVVGGKPLIAYTILQARASERIDRVLVSTDDRGIADIARKWGAEVPFLRPSAFAQDTSPDIDVFRHALRWLAEHEQYLPSLVVHLRPPTPVRRVELIDQAIDLLESHPEADAVRSVNVAQQTPYKMWRIGEGGYLEPVLKVEGLPDCQSLPRQQVPIVYWQNGYVDVIRPRAVLEKNSMWGDRVLPLVIEEPLLELDYPEQIPAIEQALRDASAGKSPPSESPFRHPV